MGANVGTSTVTATSGAPGASTRTPRRCADARRGTTRRCAGDEHGGVRPGGGRGFRVRRGDAGKGAEMTGCDIASVAEEAEARYRDGQEPEPEMRGAGGRAPAWVRLGEVRCGRMEGGRFVMERGERQGRARRPPVPSRNGRARTSGPWSSEASGTGRRGRPPARSARIRRRCPRGRGGARPWTACHTPTPPPGRRGDGRACVRIRKPRERSQAFAAGAIEVDSGAVLSVQHVRIQSEAQPPLSGALVASGSVCGGVSPPPPRPRPPRAVRIYTQGRFSASGQAPSRQAGPRKCNCVGIILNRVISSVQVSFTAARC